MGFVAPIPAIIISLCFLGILLYKRLNLGIVLSVTALLLAFLALDWQTIPTVIYEASIDPLTISVVLATFGIMLLSQLYRETGLINDLSENLIRIIKEPKVVLSVLPAVIGLLPVSGGALMSAPLVDSEAEKLGLKPNKKAYVNLWFRHTIFPVYPLSQVLIVAAAATGTPMSLMLLRQIPVVIVMVIVGYTIGFWKTAAHNKKENSEFEKMPKPSHGLLTAFSPIIAAIIVAIALELAGLDFAKIGLDVAFAAFAGVIVLILITRPNLHVFSRPLKSWGIYGVTLAAYGAFLLKGTILATGIPEIFQSTIAANSGIDIALLLIIIPAALGFLTASALGGVAVSVPILAGVLNTFSAKTASLIYMSAYLGYVIAPTHLCLAFTADYFKCSLDKLYKYVIPSFLITYATVLLIYFLF